MKYQWKELKTIALCGLLLVGNGNVLQALDDPFECDGTPYIIAGESDDTTLYWLDKENFDATEINHVHDDTDNLGANGMGYNIQDNFVYALYSDGGDGSASEKDLIRFNNDGLVEYLGTPTGATGTEATWGDVGTATGTMDSDDHWYGLGGGNLYVADVSDIDNITYETKSLSDDVSPWDITFNVTNGKMYGVKDGKLYEISTEGEVAEITLSGDALPVNCGGSWSTSRGEMYFYDNRVRKKRDGKKEGERLYKVEMTSDTEANVDEIKNVDDYAKFDATACRPPFLTKEVDKRYHANGDQFMYNFKLYNPFTKDINVTFSDILVDELTYVDDSLNPNPPTSEATVDSATDHNITISDITLPASDMVEFNISVEVDDAIDEKMDIDNMANLIYGDNVLRSDDPDTSTTEDNTTIHIVPKITVYDTSAIEDENIVFDVNLSFASDEDIDLTLDLIDGSADWDVDTDSDTLEYSTDDGDSWTTFNSGDAITVDAGDTNIKVRLHTLDDDDDEESFYLKASDSTDKTANDDANGTGTIEVDTSNTAPVATDNSQTVDEDNDATGNVISDDDGNGVDSDEDGDDLTVTTFKVDTDGDGTDETFNDGETATITDVGDITINEDGSYTFSPVENYNGDVPTITYTITDGTDEASAELAITVNAVTDPITDDNEAVEVEEDSGDTDGNLFDNLTDADSDSHSITAARVDVDGDGTDDDLTLGTATEIKDADGATLGSITVNEDGTYTFTTEENVNGDMPTITYDIVDDNDDTDTDSSTLDITVNDVNDAPVAEDDSATTDEDIVVEIDILENDSDVDGTIDTTTVTITKEPEHGTVTVDENGKVTYTPDENYNGEDSFSYTVKDDDGTVSNEAKVALTINAVNDAPIATNNENSTKEDTEVTGNLITDDEGHGVDSDIDGDDLSITKFTVNGTEYDAGETVELDAGTLTIENDGTYIFTPAQNSTENLPEVVYTLSDGELTDTATLNIEVKSVNDAPVAEDTIADSHINKPGNYCLMTPTLVYSDTEDGKPDQIKITTLPTNATLYYEHEMVQLNQVINNLNNEQLCIDPYDAATNVNFDFVAIDSEGLESNTGVITMPLYHGAVGEPTPTPTPNNTDAQSVSDIEIDSATLHWADNTEGEFGYKIYDMDGNIVAIVDEGVTSYTLIGLKDNTEYTFEIVPFNGHSEGKVQIITFKTKDAYGWLIPIRTLILQ